jgi:signal transduction histidine kinase
MLPALSDLAAYRIIQEALTNASKHAPGAWAHVQLQWTPTQLEVWIDNGPAPVKGHRGAGTGHGLLWMRERAHAAGGTLRTGQRTDGGFAVAAVIPVSQDEQKAEAS